MTPKTSDWEQVERPETGHSTKKWKLNNTNAIGYLLVDRSHWNNVKTFIEESTKLNMKLKPSLILNASDSKVLFHFRKTLAYTSDRHYRWKCYFN